MHIDPKYLLTEERMDLYNRIANAIDQNLPTAPIEEVGNLDYDGLNLDGFDVGFGFTEKIKKVKKSAIATKESLAATVKEKRDVLKKELKNPPMVRLKDKISFTLGVGNIALTMFVLGKWPEHFYWIYTIKFPLLIGLRYYIYHKMKWHYFLLDFCYFANVLFLSYLHLFPHSCTLFRISFVFSSGPLLWAIALWNNSMVFHSLDKTTSLYIHLTPSLVAWALRWWPNEHFNTCQGEDVAMPWSSAVFYPLVWYCIWQLLYYVKVQVFDVYKFKRDPNYMTSYRWMTGEKSKGTLMYRLSLLAGPKYQMWMFGVMQLLYTVLTLIPIKWFYHSFWAHTVFIILMGLVSAWNGAAFYIEVFSIRYQESLRACEKHYKELSELLAKDKDKKNE